MLEWDLPFAKWFVGGTLNVSYNCLDRHVGGGPGRQGRLPLGGRAGRHPHHHLRRAARRGVPLRQRAARASACSAGDRVAIYMPMIPELPIAMLACTRIGAAHSVIFGGFSARLASSTGSTTPRPSPVVTADGGYRAGQPAAAQAERRRGGDADARRSSTSSWWTAPASDVDMDGRPRPLVARPDGATPRRECPPSRWTARTCSTCSTPRAPRPSPRASCTPPAGYLTQVAFTHKYVFDLHPETDVYWCAADIGWVTGHSYIVYGPLATAPRR